MTAEGGTVTTKVPFPCWKIVRVPPPLAVTIPSISTELLLHGVAVVVTTAPVGVGVAVAAVLVGVLVGGVPVTVGVTVSVCAGALGLPRGVMTTVERFEIRTSTATVAPPTTAMLPFASMSPRENWKDWLPPGTPMMVKLPEPSVTAAWPD